MHVFIDKEQGIIAAGPALAFTEKLPSAPFTAWTTTARIVLRSTPGPDFPYEIARQVLDDKGNHFEYQYVRPYGNHEKAARAFSEAINALILYAEFNPPQDAASEPTEALKPKQIAAVRDDGKLVVVARTYDVNDRPRKGDFALKFEPEFLPRVGDRQAPDTIYRDNYRTLKGMVERNHQVEWLEACMYNL